MKKLLLATVAATLLLPAAPASAAPDKTGKVEVGKPFTWEGTRATGLNSTYWDEYEASPEAACGKNVDDYCETVLVEFVNPLTQAEIDQGRTQKTKGATVTIDTFSPLPNPVTDFDLFAYASDETGKPGDFLASSGASAQDGEETVSFEVTTTLEKPSAHVLLHVVYYTVVQSGYTGRARF